MIRNEIQTTRFVGFSNKKSPKKLQVCYFCHPLYKKKEVTYLYRRKWNGSYYYIITLSDNSRAFLPEWMTDPFICKNLELKEEPVCSLNALNSLHEFLKHF